MFSKPLAVAVLCALATANTLTAAQPSATFIEVEKMCCASCAKKIAAKLYTVRGVAQVKADVKKQMMYVIPQQGVGVSPRALWIAIEQSDYRPVHLAGPNGAFTSTPPF